MNAPDLSTKALVASFIERWKAEPHLGYEQMMDNVHPIVSSAMRLTHFAETIDAQGIAAWGEQLTLRTDAGALSELLGGASHMEIGTSREMLRCLTAFLLARLRCSLNGSISGEVDPARVIEYIETCQQIDRSWREMDAAERAETIEAIPKQYKAIQSKIGKPLGAKA